MALSILEKVAQLHVTYMGDSLKRLKKVGLDDAELITRNLVYIARTLCRQPGWKEYYARLRAPAQQVCDIVLDKGELIEDYRIQHTDPRYDTVIHGDFHAQNIIFDGSNGTNPQKAYSLDLYQLMYTMPILIDLRLIAD